MASSAILSEHELSKEVIRQALSPGESSDSDEEEEDSVMQHDSEDDSSSSSDESDNNKKERSVAIEMSILTREDMAKILESNARVYLWCKIVLFMYSFVSGLLMGWGFRKNPPAWFNFLMFVNIVLCLLGIAGCLIHRAMFLRIPLFGLGFIITVNALVTVKYLLSDAMRRECDTRCQNYTLLGYKQTEHCKDKVCRQLTWEIIFLLSIYIAVSSIGVAFVYHTWTTLTKEELLPDIDSLPKSDTKDQGLAALSALNTKEEMFRRSSTILNPSAVNRSSSSSIGGADSSTAYSPIISSALEIPVSSSHFKQE